MTRAEELLPRFLDDRLALTRRQAEADRLIAAVARRPPRARPAAAPDGAPRPGLDRPWRLDPVPLVLDGEVFDELAAGVAERMRGDGGAARRPLRAAAGACARAGCRPRRWRRRARYRLAAVGAPPPPRWLTTYAVDVVALADGSWRVVQDLADTPTGIGYALLDRSVMARVAAELLGPEGTGDLASISGFPAELRHALAATTPVAEPAHRAVLRRRRRRRRTSSTRRSPGCSASTSSRRPTSSCARAGCGCARSAGSTRSTSSTAGSPTPRVDPIEVERDRRRPACRGCCSRRPRAASCSPTPTARGVARGPALAPYWAGGRRGADRARASTCRCSAPATELAARAGVPRRPGSARRHVVVRLHAVAGPDGVTVMAGGNGRVLDRRRRSAAADGAAGQGRVGARRRPGGAGDRRAAAAAGRPRVVRADACRRRAVLARPGRRAGRGDRQDGARHRLAPPDRTRRWRRSTAAAGRAAWRTCCASCAARRSTPSRPTGRPIVVLDARAGRARRGPSASGSTALLAEAATVGEYLSVTTGRVLRQPGRVARRASPTAGRPIDALDACIADLAAFAGLWDESTVRGPAWRFGDIGRRIERSLGRARPRRRLPAPGTDEAVAAARGIEAGDVVDRAALEVLLAANESLVAYRRHHRSDVELGGGRRTCCCTTSTTRARTWRRVAPARRARRGRRLEPRAAGPSPSSPASSTTTTCSRGVGDGLRGRRGASASSSSTRGSPRR